MSQKQSFNAIDNVLLILWGIGGLVAILLVIAIFKIGLHNVKDVAPLIGAFAILISAGLASTSVMKSIYVTKLNEIRKHEKEESKFYLDKCIQYLSHVYELLGNRQNDIFSWKEASITLIEMKNISKHIMEESHKKIFDLEFSIHSSKLARSIIMIQNGSYDPITSIFFLPDIREKGIDLKEAFEKSRLQIHPMVIIPVFDFAEPNNNTFMRSSIDYKDWKNVDLHRPENSLLSLCALEYINLYKARESEQ